MLDMIDMTKKYHFAWDHNASNHMQRSRTLFLMYAQVELSHIQRHEVIGFYAFIPPKFSLEAGPDAINDG